MILQVWTGAKIYSKWLAVIRVTVVKSSDSRNHPNHTWKQQVCPRSVVFSNMGLFSPQINGLFISVFLLPIGWLYATYPNFYQNLKILLTKWWFSKCLVRESPQKLGYVLLVIFYGWNSHGSHHHEKKTPFGRMFFSELFLGISSLKQIQVRAKAPEHWCFGRKCPFGAKYLFSSAFWIVLVEQFLTHLTDSFLMVSSRVFSIMWYV